MQRGIQRTLLDLQQLVGDELDALRDGVAVNRSGRDYAQDEQVEGALWKIESGWSLYAYDFYMYSIYL